MNVDEYKQRIGDYDRTFKSVSGQRVLDDLRRLFGDRASFVAGDPYATAFREGARSVYLMILGTISLAQNPERLAEKLAALQEGELEDNG